MNINSDDLHVRITEHDLPQTFVLKFLGRCEARGLWGIKHTRDPVNAMINYAKSHDLSLPLIQFKVTKEGIIVTPLKSTCESHKCNNNNNNYNNNNPEIIKEKEASKPQEVINPETKNNINKKILINKKCKSEQSKTIKQSIFGLKLLKTNKDDNGNIKSKTTPADIIIKEKMERMEESQKQIVMGNDKQEKGVCDDDNDDDDDLAITKHLNDLDVICRNATMREMKRLGTTELRTDLKLLNKMKSSNWGKNGKLFYGIDTISYGVQDLIFTRVFSMIIVSDFDDNESIHKHSPFTCYAYVCDSRSTARRLTYSLAAAFQVYSRTVKALKAVEKPIRIINNEKPKMIAIDLRTTEEIESQKFRAPYDSEA